MIIAPLKEGREEDVRKLLDSLNHAAAPGMADADCERFPFRQFDTIHFARFAVIDDRTLIDFLALLSMRDCVFLNVLFLPEQYLSKP